MAYRYKPRRQEKQSWGGDCDVDEQKRNFGSAFIGEISSKMTGIRYLSSDNFVQMVVD